MQNLMEKTKLWKPYLFEDSKIPVWLSKIAPIEIYAVSFFIFVWCRSKMPYYVQRHETIHFQQQLELLFIGQWILYGLFYVKNFIKYKGDGRRSYINNPFELEAYANEKNYNYLKERKRYNWIKYIK